MAIEQCLKGDERYIDFGQLGEAGGSYTREITIRNDCEHEISVFGAFEAKVDGSPVSEHSSAEWLTFVGGEDSFTMGAKSSKTLQIRGYVPATAAGSSYYAELSLKNTSSDQHDAEYGDKLAIPVRMDIVKGDAVVAGHLEKNSAQFLDFDGTINAEAVVSGNGEYGFRIEYKLEKSPAFGLEDYTEIVSSSCEVRAGEKCTMNADRVEANTGQYGVYKIRQTVNYVNNEGRRVESVLTQTVMNLPGVTLFIAGGVLFALIMLFLVSKAIKYSRRDKAEAKKNREREITPEEEDAEEEDRLEESAKEAAKRKRAEAKEEKRRAKERLKAEKKNKKKK